MNKPYLIAGGLVVLTSVWVASGVLSGNESADSQETNADAANQQMIVEAQRMTAESITPFIIAHGNLAPDRIVELKNEISGQVEEIFVREGGHVTEGQALLQLKLNDKLIRREQAQLKIDETRRNYEAINNLTDRGFASQNQVDTALVQQKMAEVELAQVNLEIENSTIRAPFDGILDQLDVELGEYLGVGANLLTLVDNDPLVVNVRVPQQSINTLSPGQEVRVTMVDNQEASGKIRFIASRGDEATRTFRVEIEIENHGEGLRAGSSATAYIPRTPIKAHFVSGGLLTLNTEGQMGVKTVSNEGLVSFYPVKVEYSEAGGMWVSGLPETANVITSGQGFADTGRTVTVANMNTQPAVEHRVQASLEGASDADVD